MIEFVESAGEGTLIAHGICNALEIKTDRTVSILESKDVPGAFAVVVEGDERTMRFRACGPDCETGK
jgi:hypothetical protein